MTASRSSVPGTRCGWSLILALDALLEGWARDYFFYADGFAKDMDFYAAHGYTVEPLPFHAMRGCP